ncbi:MAG: hypothetical protein HKP55_03165 [Gammaproteobacteria bacterium]|nr:hypothetical protein [Gammaproteobacteria bacterium]NNJ90654.1 hypothetical protein [Gammaproteobacteria bacterium]
MKLVNPFSVQHSQWLLILITTLSIYGCKAPEVKPTQTSSSEVVATSEPATLLGEWCKVKKRRVTKYRLDTDKLQIISGRSGQRFDVALKCNENFTECVTKTIRGWGSPVTEKMRLDGENMQLKRIWGGAWNDKTYEFTFTRCPKW